MPDSPDSGGAVTLHLGACAARVGIALRELDGARIVARIWARDHTVWSAEPTEIANRLGWLDGPATMRPVVGELRALVASSRADGLGHVLLLGMGGSSLAPELFARTFADAGGLPLTVLDSTDPAAVLARTEPLDPARTLHVVATKSGGTVETFSFLRYTYDRALAALGQVEAGRRFVAITDPGSTLAEVASRLGFRASLLNDPDIGGRFSALSYFGLVPAALVGVDIDRLLDRADAMAGACGPDVPAGDNPAGVLGAAMAELAGSGRDKLTLVVSPGLPGLGDWIEQLIAESTGKDGRGILPVAGEPVGAPGAYGDDRLFVHVRLAGDASLDAGVAALVGAGHPAITVRVADRYDLGGQLLLWELATAIAGHRLGIQPFDQPNVEAAKVRARETVAAYRATGALPAPEPSLVADGIAAYRDGGTPGEWVQIPPGIHPVSTAGVPKASDGTASASPSHRVTTVYHALAMFLAGATPGPGVYVALQAFVPPTPETDRALAELRARIRGATRLAVTVGYGPRFLHSTGQLHKGDAGLGRFVQLTCDDPVDVPIPDEPGRAASNLTFGVLKAAQALGDRQALLDAGRRVLRLHLGPDVPAALRRLADGF